MKIMKKLCAIGLAVSLLMPSANSLAASKQQRINDNMWLALSQDFGYTLVSGLCPDQFAVKGAPEKRVSRINYSYSTWSEPTEYYLFKYDGKKRLKKIEAFSHGTESAPYYKNFEFRYSYDGDGHLTGSKYYNQGKLNNTEEVETNKKGMIIATEGINHVSGNEDSSTFSYNGSRLIKSVYHNSDENRWPPSSKTIKYAKDGKILSAVLKNLKTGTTTVRYDFVYDESGRVSTVNEKRAGQEGLEIHEISYDSDGYISQLRKRHPGADYTMNTDIIYTQ